MALMGFMEEKLYGIALRGKRLSLNFCFSVNVFSFGFEFYPETYLVRFGPLLVFVDIENELD